MRKYRYESPLSTSPRPDKATHTPYPSGKINQRDVSEIIQALDVELQEPDMEVSAKQEGAKRFDDPGIAAALSGDTDPDGPGGGLLSGVVNRGKLEPKVT